jgi:hypothetical protein
VSCIGFEIDDMDGLILMNEVCGSVDHRVWDGDGNGIDVRVSVGW